LVSKSGKLHREIEGLSLIHSPLDIYVKVINTSGTEPQILFTEHPVG